MTMVMTAAGINMAAPQRRIMTTQVKSTAQIYSASFSSVLDPRWRLSGELPMPLPLPLPSIIKALRFRFS
jgi:hypothetical protein